MPLYTLVCLTIHVPCVLVRGDSQVRVKYIIVSLKIEEEKIIQVNFRFLSTSHTFRSAFVSPRFVLFS